MFIRFLFSIRASQEKGRAVHCLKQISVIRRPKIDRVYQSIQRCFWVPGRGAGTEGAELTAPTLVSVVVIRHHQRVAIGFGITDQEAFC